MDGKELQIDHHALLEGGRRQKSVELNPDDFMLLSWFGESCKIVVL